MTALEHRPSNHTTPQHPRYRHSSTTGEENDTSINLSLIVGCLLIRERETNRGSMAERRSVTPTEYRDMDPAIITSNSATNITSLTTLRLREFSAPTATGRCLLAQFTDREVIVYQAYKPELGNFAVENQYFGGDGFNFKRTSWIKPNFTWMMHRCGWASKQNQEVVLALALRRDFWDNVLSQAVMSNYESYRSTMSAEVPRGDVQRRWKASLQASDVVMQWDPDHMPFTGHKTNHRAIQLGLRGDALAAFRGPAFGETGIQDVSAFAKATEEIHRPRAADGGGGGGHPAAPAATSPPALLLPIEETYPVMDTSVAQRLGIDEQARTGFGTGGGVWVMT